MNRLPIIVILLMLITVVGCKKTRGPANVKSAQPDNSIDSLLSMTAAINGAPWQTDSAYSYKVKNSGNDSGIINLMVIATQRKNNAASTITFNISDFKGVKEYIISPPLNTATYYAGNQRHYATSGIFSIRKDSGNMLSGTFSFEADTVMVTNGTFIVALP